MMIALMIAGGLILLALGAEGLVRGSGSLALRMGVTPLVVGLTIVAFGTGSPELVVCIEAALAGNSDIALGNVVGSNISNIALILGISALIRPLEVRSELLRREVPLMIGVTLLLCLLLLDGALSRPEGVLLVAGSVAYTWLTYWAASRNRGDALVEEASGEAAALPRRRTWLDILFIACGIAALVLGARLLLDGAIVVAGWLGISQIVIGLTIVAVGTSLPELATSAVAAHKGEADVAFGNVVGSNVLNILFMLGVAAVIQPMSAAGLRAFDLGALLASAVLLLPVLWSGSILSRKEGVLLVAAYAAYVYTLVP
ncbi:MAG TPA: calcium/sodium antiporter [Pyrinomonadaceae bacterium]|nr:calcium/sodium antiporter [Pyrinomonadaceae bacterium]